MNRENFVYFTLIDINRINYSFNSYTDLETGEFKAIKSGTDKSGNATYRMFRFSQSEATIRVPKYQEEVIEFLRNCPQCEKKNEEGEVVNARYAIFREMNDNNDAIVALKAKKTKNEAMTKALSLEGDKLVLVAAQLGSFYSPEEEHKLQHAVTEFAGTKPIDFLEIINEPDLEYRATVRIAIKSKVLETKGSMILWKGDVIGNDEDGAVTKLSNDKKMFTALKQAIKRAGA